MSKAQNQKTLIYTQQIVIDDFLHTVSRALHYLDYGRDLQAAHMLRALYERHDNINRRGAEA